MAEEDDEPVGRAKGGYARKEALPEERRIEIAKLAAEARWAQPLQLIEDAETGDRFVLYTTPKGQEFRLKFQGDEPWATQKQMAELFGLDVKTVNQHLRHIFKDGELAKQATISKYEIVQTEGSRTVRREVAIYSLDCILAVGYRATSTQAIIFRRWATDVLRQYLLHGFVIDVPRLEDPDDDRPDHFADLLAKVRHIRSSEKRMWTRVLELASFCSDYGVMTDDDKQEFFATIQNAMHWAVTQHTAAEVIHDRVDASKSNAGVVSFKGEMPTSEEAKVAKNLYFPGEIETLNLVTGLTLEFFESQADQRRPTTLAQFLQKMRDLLKVDGRPLIRADDRGRVTMTAAKAKASAEIKAFKERVRVEREIDGERALRQIGDQVKKRGSPRAKKPSPSASGP